MTNNLNDTFKEIDRYDDEFKVHKNKKRFIPLKE